MRVGLTSWWPQGLILLAALRSWPLPPTGSSRDGGGGLVSLGQLLPVHPSPIPCRRSPSTHDVELLDLEHAVGIGEEHADPRAVAPAPGGEGDDLEDGARRVEDRNGEGVAGHRILISGAEGEPGEGGWGGNHRVGF